MKKLIFTFLVLAMNALGLSDAYAEWSIDLSRRTQHMRKEELVRGPASVRAYDEAGSGSRVQDSAAGSSKEEEQTFI
ncbi:MAG: hypothetical protein JNJ49_13750, partial [Bdellovibrionaceae bacterium]|nr:hypothetical protein [Pseudobdellovibrionaceae bacterium]